MIRIVQYSKKYHDEIDSMLAEIASEFELSIYSSNNSIKSNTLDHYWIALDKSKVVGTIGLLKISQQNVVLKNMFVRKTHRGATIGLSISLLQKALDWCNLEKVPHLYLGTMSQFKAAHKFYEKNGFQQISKNKLPENFKTNPMDDLFYKKNTTFDSITLNLF